MSSLRNMGIEKNSEKLGVSESFIPGANLGLFARIIFEEGNEIDDCIGPEVGGDHDSLFGGMYTLYARDTSHTVHRTVDMGDPTSCFARYANDRINDDEDNARVVLDGEVIKLIAICTIMPGDEITYSYSRDYWIKHRDSLSESARQRMFAYFKIKETDLIYLECCFLSGSLRADNHYRLNHGWGEGLLGKTGTSAMVGKEDKSRGDGKHLLTNRLKNSDQGVILCYIRTPKSELGASQLDRLGMMVTAGDEGKGREDGEQLLTSRLKKTDQGTIYRYIRTPKSERGASQLDRPGKMMTAGDEGKGRGEGEQLLTVRLKKQTKG